MIRIMKRDKSVGTFHPMDVIMRSWRVPIKLCKLLLLQHHFDVNEQHFFNLLKDQNMHRKKCNSVLQSWLWVNEDGETK